jgi:hypothetical protein
MVREGAQAAARNGDEVVDTTRFVGEPNGTLVDIEATPRGSYTQPDGGRTDILQGHDSGAGYSHTHPSVTNVNPTTGISYVNRLGQGRPTTAQEVNNISLGVALRRSPLRR